jgi:hypothetical protein
MEDGGEIEAKSSIHMKSKYFDPLRLHRSRPISSNDSHLTLHQPIMATDQRPTTATKFNTAVHTVLECFWNSILHWAGYVSKEVRYDQSWPGNRVVYATYDTRQGYPSFAQWESSDPGFKIGHDLSEIRAYIRGYKYKDVMDIWKEVQKFDNTMYGLDKYSITSHSEDIGGTKRNLVQKLDEAASSYGKSHCRWQSWSSVDQNICLI